MVISLFVKIIIGLFMALVGMTYWLYKEMNWFSLDLQKQLNKKVVEKNQERARTSILETKVSDLRRGNERFTSAVSQLETEVKDLHSLNEELVKSEKSNKTIIEENQKLLRKFEGEVQLLEDGLNEKENQLEEQKSVIEQLQSKVQNQSEEIGQQADEIKDHQRIETELKKQLKKYSAIEEQLAARNKELVEKKRKLSELRQELSQARNKLIKNEKEFLHMRNESDHLSQHSERLEEDLILSQSQLESVEQEVVQAQAQIQSLQAELGASVASADSWSKEAEQSKIRVSELSDELKENQSKLESAEKELLVLGNQKADIESELNFSKKTIEEMEISSEKIQSQVDELQQHYMQREQKLGDTINDLKNDKKQQMDLVKTMGEKMREKNIELSELKDLVKESVAALKQAQKQIQNIQSVEPTSRVAPVRSVMPAQARGGESISSVSSQNEVKVLEKMLRRSERRLIKAYERNRKMEKEIVQLREEKPLQSRAEPAAAVIPFPQQQTRAKKISQIKQDITHLNIKQKSGDLGEIELIKAKIDQARKDLYTIQAMAAGE